MSIHLPTEKSQEWLLMIEDLLTTKQCSAHNLEKLIGRLVRTSLILPGSSAFLSNLYQEFYKNKGQDIILDCETCEDLEFWKRLINKAKAGTNINGLVLHEIDIIIFTDASGTGIGWFDATTGICQRYPFGIAFVNSISINYLEYITAIAALKSKLESGELENKQVFL